MRRIDLCVGAEGVGGLEPSSHVRCSRAKGGTARRVDRGPHDTTPFAERRARRTAVLLNDFDHIDFNEVLGQYLVSLTAPRFDFC